MSNYNPTPDFVQTGSCRKQTVEKRPIAGKNAFHRV
jgi:hypothetical protein